MRLQFLGIIPNTPDTDSPTIWVDEESGDLPIQSYKATEAEVKACQEVGSIPGHSTDIPSHETVIRLPKVMRQFLPRHDSEFSHDEPRA
ncbi:hypothetical protein ACWEJP_21945 [Streptomyces sp. NPDC004749]